MCCPCHDCRYKHLYFKSETQEGIKKEFWNFGVWRPCIFVWQRFCEPARLRIAYCLWVRLYVCVPCLVRHGSENLSRWPLDTLQIHYQYSPLPDKLSAEDRSFFDGKVSAQLSSICTSQRLPAGHHIKIQCCQPCSFLIRNSDFICTYHLHLSTLFITWI